MSNLVAVNAQKAFVEKKDTIVNRLTSHVILSNDEKSCLVNALWDTGASTSAISCEVVKKLSLIPRQNKNHNSVYTPIGKKDDIQSFIVNVSFDTRFSICNVPVIELDIHIQKIDMIIGMDIISSGDFSVSNHNRKTTFSFRMPSLIETDYTKDISSQYEDIIKSIEEFNK